jgi:pyridoxine 4-dehydrogenase
MPAGDHHRHFPRFPAGESSQEHRARGRGGETGRGQGLHHGTAGIELDQGQGMRSGMPIIILVFGVNSEARIVGNVAEVPLDDENLAAIDTVLARFEVAGTRYPHGACIWLDSDVVGQCQSKPAGDQ